MVIYPLTRFAYVYLMVANAMKNKKVLMLMGHEPEWALTKKKYKGSDFDKFETIVNVTSNWTKAAAVRKILEPLSVMLHFLEGDSISSAYILPLYARAQMLRSPTTSVRGMLPLLVVTADCRHSRISAICLACLSWSECSR